MKTIGVVDSGIGGLAIVQLLLKTFPARYYYCADTKNFPYGSRSKQELLERARRNTELLLVHGVDVVLLACHTLSAVVLDDLKLLYPATQFVGIIDPMIKTAVLNSKNKKIAVLATTATVNSHIYTQKISRFLPDAEVREVACPSLASFIEQHMFDQCRKTPELTQYLEGILELSTDMLIDTVILGCTHYEWIKDDIKAFVRCSVVSAEAAVATLFEHDKYEHSVASELVCMLSQSNRSINERFEHILRGLRVPFSIA